MPDGSDCWLLTAADVAAAVAAVLLLLLWLLPDDYDNICSASACAHIVYIFTDGSWLYAFCHCLHTIQKLLRNIFYALHTRLLI